MLGVPRPRDQTEHARVSNEDPEIIHASYGGKNQFVFYEGRAEIGEIVVERGPEGYVVTNVLVWPQFQRRGWATKMYRHVVEWARGQGASVHAGSDQSQDARALHASFVRRGFE